MKEVHLAEGTPSGLELQYKHMRHVLFLTALLFVTSPKQQAQDINEQKKVVAFAFGTIKPSNADGTPMKNASGVPLEAEIPLGTAFFVSYPDARGGPDYGFFYVVTAKHVLKDPRGAFLKEIKLRLNLKQAEKVAEGDLLYFIGLMTQYYGDLKNYPVVRRGALGIMTDEKIETPTGRQKAFIAELTSWPGNSGSPVFLNLTGLRGGNLSLGVNLKFLGILCGSFLNKFKATVLNADTLVAGNDLNTGVSYIIPADRVRAVLDSPAAQANRDAQIQQLNKK